MTLQSTRLDTRVSGGAIGSAASSYAWSAGGWEAVTALGAAVAAAGLLLWATDRGTR